MLPKLLSVNALYQRLQQANDLLLLDVRNSEEFKRSRIETRHTPETINIPYMAFVEDDTLEEAVNRIPRERPVVVICAHGGSSEYVAGILRRRGYSVANLASGIEGWSRLHVVRPIVRDELVKIYQIDRVARGCLSYVIISEGRAAVIDPSYYVGEYHSLLSDCGASLRLVVDTHCHADHISGGAALSEATGAPYYLHPHDAIHPVEAAPAAIHHHELHHGYGFRFGHIVLRAIHTPGHTLGHVSLLATTARGHAYLFSGDSLFLTSIGRPDLGGQAEAWSHLAYNTLFVTLRSAIPPSTVVLPGHYAEHQEADSSGLFLASLEELWRTNKDLGFTDVDTFVRHVQASLPGTPDEYAEIKRVNVGLSSADSQRALALEMGRNICALSPTSL